MGSLDFFQCSNDARQRARRRLPRMLFEFIDGATGEERAVRRNRQAFGNLLLQPRVLVDVAARNIAKTFLGRQWGLPFGIAPMGMCDLSWPGTDQIGRAHV